MGTSLVWASGINTAENDSARSISIFDQQVVGAFSANAGDGGVWGQAVVKAFDKTSGTVLWEKSFGTPDKTYVSSVAHSPDGFIYVSGGTREVINGQNYGGATDSWIARLSPTGQTLWTKNFSNHLEDDLSNLAVDEAGNAYIAGTLSRHGHRSGSGHYMSDYNYLGGDQSYGGSPFTGNWMSAIRKVSPTGDIIWTRVDGSYNSGGGSLAIDGDRRVVKTAYTFAPVNGQAMVPGFDNGNGANVNIYLISYRLDGSIEWTRMKAEITALAIDSDDHSIYVGNQNNLERLDENGNLIWSRSLGAKANDIVVARNGNVHVITKSATTTLREAIWDRSGNLIQATDHVATGELNIGDIAVGADGTRYLSGSISGGVLNNSNLTTGGKSDAVLWSFGDPVQRTPSPAIRGNSLYTIVDGPSWTQAEVNAVKLGGHLATINDASENQFITENYLPSNQRSWGAWIGLADSASEGIYQWASQSNNTYLNWRNGEPNDSDHLGRGEDYAVIEPSGKWNDLFDTFLVDAPHDAIGIAEIPFIRRGDSAYVIVEGPTWGFLKKARSTAAQWISAVSGAKMCENGSI